MRSILLVITQDLTPEFDPNFLHNTTPSEGEFFSQDQPPLVTFRKEARMKMLIVCYANIFKRLYGLAGVTMKQVAGVFENSTGVDISST